MKRRTPGGVGLALAVSAVVVVMVGPAGEAVPAGAPGRADRAPGNGTVTVRVVNEVDVDGGYDYPLETGRPGVRVTLTDDRGTVLTRTTNSNGAALFHPAAAPLSGGEYRVQVHNPDPARLQPAVAGLGSGPNVIRDHVGFVDVSGYRNTTYTTGFWEPDVYCQENPDLVSCSLAKGDATMRQGLARFPANFTTGSSPTRLTHNTEQQAVFGIGVDRTGNTYLGTTVKRHTAYGSRGAVNAVYRYHDGTDAVTHFVTLPGTLTAHNPAGGYLHDDAVYSRVGREGIGDVDVSGDGRTLFAVNLNDSKLYRVPINGSGNNVTPGIWSSHAVPRPRDCEGQWHPYGLGVRGKRVLVGGVCGAENTVTSTVPYGDPARLSAHVFEFRSGMFDEIFRHRLNHPRGCAYQPRPTADSPCRTASSVGGTLSARWEAWNERVPAVFEPTGRRFASAPQPILSNLEIADDGDLILGYRDRFADMQGNATYAYRSTTRLMRAIAAGDILRACGRGSGGYALETNGDCGPLDGSLPNNDLGPGGGEFGNDLTVLGDAQHHQVSQGGTALQPFRKKLWGTVYDPVDHRPFAQGVRRWASETGSIQSNIRLQSTSSTSADLFGKANGLADLALVCDQAPVQIGNRVWFDSNGNGVQDPSEPPVKGVKVTLDPRPPGPNLVTHTDAHGEYRFGTEQGLRPNTTYRATFGFGGIDPKALPGHPSPSSLTWTVRGARSNQAIDSDVDAYGRATIYVGGPGYVSHSIDAGLTKALRLTLLKSDRENTEPLPGAVFELWQDTNGVPGLQRYGVTKDRFINDCATSYSGRCSFGSLPAGMYYLVETDVPKGYLPPKQPVSGPYALTPKNASPGDGLRVKLVNERDKPCGKGKKC